MRYSVTRPYRIANHNAKAPPQANKIVPLIDAPQVA
jgi:hypothetical protein